MSKVNQYIKRLVAFFICVTLFYTSLSILLPVFISIPILSIAFALLHFRITEEKPPFLFAFNRTEEYFKKGGLRDFLRILVSIFGFLYDIIVWAVWGIYLVFVLFIDLLDLIKTILFWIIHALLWILRQYVPFIVFLYQMSIHYLIKWPWWLYQIAYNNIKYAFNANSYRIALPGTLLAGFIIFLFYFIEVLLKDIPGLTFIGIIIALLPLTWSLGEIASLRAQKTEKESYKTVKSKFQNGLEAVRSILFYITLFVVLLLTQIGLNLLGWIPNSGVPLGGMVFNINTFISLLLLFLCILIVMGVIIIPSYRIYNSFSELKFADTARLLGVILKRFLQYFIITIPSKIFSVFVVIIPLLIITIVTYFTMFVKDNIIDIKIENLKTEQVATRDLVLADAFNKRIEHLEDLQRFPLNVKQKLNHIGEQSSEILIDLEDLKTANEEYLRREEFYVKRLDTLQQLIEIREAGNPNDLSIPRLKNEKLQTETQFESFRSAKKLEIGILSNNIRYLQLQQKQMPILFFFAGIWLVIFGGMVYAFVVSYLGNVFHRLFVFRNDTNISYWSANITRIREKDPKQPLLGGTLFLFTAAIIYFLLTNISLLGVIVTFTEKIFTF